MIRIFATESRAPQAEALKQEAAVKVEKVPTIDARIALSWLANQPLAMPNEEQNQRLLSQWVFDPATQLGDDSECVLIITAEGSKHAGSFMELTTGLRGRLLVAKTEAREAKPRTDA